jgi:Cd(II)/Pb(II)-responsive transcriptional regulator
MKIGEISKTTGIAVETIRYYEKIGLVPAPEREVSGYRSYRQHHLDRLLFIRRCRNLDMAQDEIRELIELADQPDADCSQVDALLAQHLEHVRQRLDELTHLEDTLTQLQTSCSQGRTVSECSILGGLSSGALPEPEIDSKNHIPGSHGPNS